MSKIDKICPICGNAVPRGRRKYCSPVCERAAFNAARRTRIESKKKETKDVTPVEKICPVCGNSFIPEDPKRKYCSQECYKVVHLEKCKEYRERKKNGEPARKKKWETVGDKRPCHGCGKPSYNYWCPACWRKRAQKYGIPEEDVPGVRWYEQEVE